MERQLFFGNSYGSKTMLTHRELSGTSTDTLHLASFDFSWLHLVGLLRDSNGAILQVDPYVHPTHRSTCVVRRDMQKQTDQKATSMLRNVSNLLLTYWLSDKIESHGSLRASGTTSSFIAPDSKGAPALTSGSAWIWTQQCKV